MIQTLPKVTTFEEFVTELPENSGVRYELHNGNIIEMAQPVGDHEEIKGFSTIKLSGIIDRLDLPYLIPNQVIVRPEDKDSGYFPDVLVLNRENLANEKLWKKQSIISNAASIPLVIEVVSTNWRDDYHLKYADYEEMGIPEYWIVDYAALGGRNFIGNPKQATISVCNLVDGEYQISKFRDHERIVSKTFPELNLTANQIFQASI
ncbi:Uma2 family endonuclease [Dolichospermum sp. ST_con]|jgi:Uma2 family endonuclease|nr:Uma2 family endonuclease [Dolichospermum sp. ST_con]MDD1417932.1 Uma2 family endonuclease [Dolichospermum sp. ST_sed1]MDD1423704.1 Uma2 family endonuclease [Dolichospermum sp. ST_sed9]MDD1431026.1 Uma2 family endonuclease [Dolichospermum sp. ST_sed6]MDD1435282.1 Uma2 family endonuclease [Dolichospermum sp. ST_sed10]MDD1439220.1 Uma2 family endonuclease [Dolichospermum sp. ST_sed3]MDD1445486.1 Uma2 family endonuclease [Dolichospermum sp. ST_sed8]MDD1453954.1 Uma2 family endonuclease [Dolic